MATATLPLPALKSARNGTPPHGAASKQDEPTARLISLSPAMAASLLETAHANRKISMARVRQLTRAMQSGRWEVNGQGLILCGDGRLLDGRHRCSAVVAANVTIETMCVVGVSPGTFSTMDAGRRRSGGDLLGIAGHPRPQTLASGARWLWRYQHVQMLSPTIELLDYELPDFVAQNPSLLASSSWGAMVRRLLPAGLATALHTTMHMVDATLTKSYYLGLAQGLELTGDSPIYDRSFRPRFQPRPRDTPSFEQLTDCSDSPPTIPPRQLPRRCGYPGAADLPMAHLLPAIAEFLRVDLLRGLLMQLVLVCCWMYFGLWS